jgi:cyclophilin family peptidyl-prolyl cis-trans isomerase
MVPSTVLDALHVPLHEVSRVPTIDELLRDSKVDTSRPQWRLSLTRPALATFDPARRYRVRMQTNKGPIVIRLLPETAPMHATSFLYLTTLGFYDGLSFHRVIKGFMAQGGCPQGDGAGGPGYRIDGEYDPKVKHDRAGLLSAANAGPGTDGSQFFLTFDETPWLNGKHTIYGVVEEGLDTLKKLEALGSESGRTSEPLTMERVTVEVA